MNTETLEEIKNDFSVLMRSTQSEIKSLKNKLIQLYLAIFICFCLTIYSIVSSNFNFSELIPSTQKSSKLRSK